MTKVTDERIPQHVFIFILLGMLAGAALISSVVLSLLPISKQYAHGIGFFAVSLMIYWLPLFRRRRRFSLPQWIGFSLLMSAIGTALALLLQALYRLF